MSRQYDLIWYEHGVEPVVRRVIEKPNIEEAFATALAVAVEWFPGATLSKAGTGKTAFLVKVDGKVRGTVAIENTARRRKGIGVADGAD